MQQTKAERREKIQKLETRLQELKNGMYMGKFHPEIKDQIAWFTTELWKLPDYEKQELREAWNEYYKKCAESPEAELYREIGKAFRESNYKRIYELQKQAQLMLKNGFERIPKPHGYDHLVWDNADWAINYRQVERDLKFLGSDSEEFENKVGGTW